MFTIRGADYFFLRFPEKLRIKTSKGQKLPRSHTQKKVLLHSRCESRVDQIHRRGRKSVTVFKENHHERNILRISRILRSNVIVVVSSSSFQSFSRDVAFFKAIRIGVLFAFSLRCAVLLLPFRDDPWNEARERAQEPFFNLRLNLSRMFYI